MTKSHWREKRCEVKVSRTVLKPSQNGDISGLGQPRPEQELLLRRTLGWVRLAEFTKFAFNFKDRQIYLVLLQ